MTQPTRVGGYCRISDDDERSGLGVGRQSEDIRSLVADRGWQLAGLYVDNSKSAFKKNVVRHEFERLLVDLQAGVIDGVAIWDCDRLARLPRDLERLIDLFDERPLVFATSQAEIDLSTPDGRFMARLLVNVANKSSADMSRRLQRKALQLAQEGKDGGGGWPPFGYEADRITIKPFEADVIRDAAQRVLSGESMTSIAHSFDDRGIMIGRTAKCDPGVLRRLLLRPRLAGIRQYRGAIMLGPDGHPVKAEWEPVLDMATWEAVKALLTDPRREIGAGRIDRKYLLSGFLRCKCGAKMYGVHKKGKQNYMCPTFRGCGKTMRIGAPIDAHVTELVLRYLESQELAPVDIEVDIEPLEADIEAAERSLAALITEWDAGRMSDSVFFAAQARREASLIALKRQRTGERRRRALRAPVGPGVREVWAAANLSQRRAILSDVLLAIQVLPKETTGRKPFEARYYVPVWREGAD